MSHRRPPVPCGGRPLFSGTSGFAIGIATWRDQQALRWLGDRCAVVLAAAAEPEVHEDRIQISRCEPTNASKTPTA